MLYILPNQILEEDAPMSPREERDVWEAMFPDLAEDEIFDLMCEFWPD